MTKDKKVTKSKVKNQKKLKVKKNESNVEKSALCIDDVIQLIKILNDEKINEFEYSTSNFSIHIKKGEKEYNDVINNLESLASKISYIPKVVPELDLVANKEENKNNVSVSVNSNNLKDESKYNFIESPITGTFYRAPSPTSPPYVEVGQRVTKGQVVCIVEAMKLMNEIKSEYNGIVEQILAENGKVVQAKQKLFCIRPE